MAATKSATVAAERGHRVTLFEAADAIGGQFRMAAAVPGSRLVILAGARHPCYLDRPREFHRALLEFLSSIGESP